MTATNGAGEGTRSAEVSATPVAVPVAPLGLVATPGSATVGLTWTAVSGATSYSVYRATSSGAETLLQGGLATASYTDNAVTNGTKYYYQVSATNGSGEGLKSAEVSATPTAKSSSTYLSDLTPTSATNGYGPYEKNTSNGEQLAGDGHTITLNGVTYAKGLGVHAPSDLKYNLGGQYTSFASDVGVDDEVVPTVRSISRCW